MTINDLIKTVPKEYHDSLIEIYIPKDMTDGDRGRSYPLIEVDINQRGTRSARVLLTADTF